MFRAALKSLLARKVRLLMSTFAVVLGVAFVAGTLVFADTLNRSFTALFASTVGDVVIAPGGQGAGGDATRARSLPAGWSAPLEELPGVARVDGNVLDAAVFVIDVNGKVIGSLGTALAGNWTGAPAGHGLRGLEILSGREPAAADEVVLEASTARRAGHGIGSEIRLLTSTDAEVLEVEVVGIAGFAEGGSFSGATWVGFETARAQELFLDGEDRFTSFWVSAAPGTDQSELRDAVRARLDGLEGASGVEVRTGDEVADEAASQLLKALSFLTTFLLVFAGISLVVGAFLIVNTFSILVAQRSRELALLRALGASRRQVSASVMVEAFVLGVVGSGAGIVLGIAMAMMIRTLFGTFGLDLSGQPLVVLPRTYLVASAVGLLVTLAAAWFPARRTAKIAPVQAMRDDVALPETSVRTRFVAGLAVVAAGGGAMVFGSRGVDGAGWWIGGGVLAVLLGVTAAAPVLSQPFLVLARVLFGATSGMVGRLATQNALRNPRRTAATASALMIGLALACTMAIVGDSAKASVDRALADNFRGDYVVSTAIGQPFSPQVGRRIAALDGVQEVAAQRFTLGDVEGVPVGLVGVEPKTLSGLLRVEMLEGSAAALERGTVLLSQSQAERLGRGLGDRLEITVEGRELSLEVVGLFEENPVLVSGVLTTPRTLGDAGVPPRDTMLVVRVERPGELVRSRIAAQVADLPTVTVKDQAAFADEQRRPINQLVTMIFALLGLALVIAVLGIVNTLALSVIERTKEIGLLRAVGLSRRQTRRMITIESVVIAALGAVLGVGLGVLFGVVLLSSLRDQGLEVVSVPHGQLALFFVVALVVGVLAAVLPARRAARLDVLAAIASE